MQTLILVNEVERYRLKAQSAIVHLLSLVKGEVEASSPTEDRQKEGASDYRPSKLNR